MSNVFQQFSDRAKRVIFLARLGAGRRGAQMIEVDDLLSALLLEDQNKFSDDFGSEGERGTVIGMKPHQPFLPADLASRLLEDIKRSLPRSESVPDSTDMGISPVLASTLALAGDLREALQSQQVTPLHLLSVLLAGVDPKLHMLRDAGITEETVVDAIRRE